MLVSLSRVKPLLLELLLLPPTLPPPSGIPRKLAPTLPELPERLLALLLPLIDELMLVSPLLSNEVTSKRANICTVRNW